MRTAKEILQNYIKVPVETVSTKNDTLYVSSALLAIKEAQREAIKKTCKRVYEYCTHYKKSNIPYHKTDVAEVEKELKAKL
jgi:hypothetical protein